MSSRSYGTCSVCSYKMRRLRSGMIGMHSLYSGGDRFVCTGSYKPDKWAVLAANNAHAFRGTMPSKSYGGSVATKPARLAKYTKSDRDTILAKYRNLQKLHAAEHDQVKHLLHLLGSLQWAYPPSDSVKDARRDKGSWFGPARCPLCFMEWNLPAKHAADCGLGNALRRD